LLQSDYFALVPGAHPDVSSIEGHSNSAAGIEGSQVLAIAGSKFGYAVVAEICDPDIGTVESEPPGLLANCEGSQNFSVAGSQLGNGSVVTIRDPDVRAIEGKANGCAAHFEASDDLSVAWPQFSYGTVAAVSRPNALTIKGNAIGLFAHVEGYTVDGSGLIRWISLRQRYV
jgi:hypothetical protein